MLIAHNNEEGLGGVLMKPIIMSIVCLFVAQGAFAEVEFLGNESLYNDKQVIVSNLKRKNGIKVKVRAVNRDEPQSMPIYIYPYIKCEKGKKYSPMDIGEVLKGAKDPSVVQMVGASDKEFKSGVVHVCAFENVNFDNDKIFITVYKNATDGSGDCDRTKVVDLKFPIQSFCEK